MNEIVFRKLVFMNFKLCILSFLRSVLYFNFLALSPYPNEVDSFSSVVPISLAFRQTDALFVCSTDKIQSKSDVKRNLYIYKSRHIWIKSKIAFICHDVNVRVREFVLSVKASVQQPCKI